MNDGKNAVTHGMSYHPGYNVWRNMGSRCRNPKHPYWKWYGGRGISVCSRWAVFDNFWADMGPTYAPGLTLDRKNNAKGYSKSNCHWVTRKANSNNRRNTVFLDTPWGRMSMSEAAEHSGLSRRTLRARWLRGETAARMFAPSGLTRTYK